MVSKRLSSPRVAVVGGGAIGLASAWSLARAGAEVVVLEAGPEAGQGALAASGGMLAQGFEGANEDAGRAFVSLAARGLALWDDWADHLSRHAQRPLGYRRSGSLVPAIGEEDAGWLDALQTASARYGIAHERLTGDEARRLEPGLSGEVGAALRFPDDGEIDNRALGPALAAALRAGNCELRTNWPVTAIEPHYGRVTVIGPASRVDADRVVIAAGWQSAALQKSVPETAHVFPVKGQMLSIGLAEQLTGCVRGRDVYFSAKPDRIVIGATSEPGASDTRVDPGQTEALRRSAARLMPGLEGAPTLDVWTGVRPATHDGLPIIGRSVCDGVVLGLGAFRNGVLLAPAIADAIRDLVLDGVVPDPAFDPRRPQTALTQA